MPWVGILAVLVLVASPTRGQIYEWRDNGVRHFTNDIDGVPADQQSTARVVIRKLKTAEPVPVVAEAEKANEPPRQAQVVYDRSGWQAGYNEGMRQGTTLAGGGGGGSGGVVQINGPLAVATSRASEAFPGYGYGGYPFAGFPYGYPFVTTSFDRGRSRGLTLRMLLKSQFQLDRDGPFRFARFPGGLGPNLAPFLPRGLPHGFPQGQRVLTRFPLPDGVVYR